MEIFGDLERILSEDLYPYRVPLSIAAVVALGLAGWIATRRGWVAALVAWARRRPVVAGVSALILAAVVLPTFWLLASPLWTRTTLVEASPLDLAAATETMTPTPEMSAPSTAPPATPATEATSPQIVLEGAWVGADDFHFAEGRALIIETEPGTFTLRVEDFSVRNGPDLFVYVSPDPAGGIEGAVKLGELKATDGAFNYEIPAGVTPEQMRSVVVWCDAFAVLFGSAVLK